jgi:hypothetical protein
VHKFIQDPLEEELNDLLERLKYGRKKPGTEDPAPAIKAIGMAIVNAP